MITSSSGHPHHGSPGANIPWHLKQLWEPRDFGATQGQDILETQLMTSMCARVYAIGLTSNVNIQWSTSHSVLGVMYSWFP